MNEVDIILLAETWEHQESKVPNIDGFVVWSIWNKQSYLRSIGGIAYYIRKNISPHASIYKKDPDNQYIWIEITDINDKKPTNQSVILPLLILTSIRKTISIKIVLTIV